MKVQKISPKVTPFLQVKLDKNVIDYLWKIIDIAKTKNENYKSKLAGNISSSISLDDLNSFFYKTVCIPLVKYYRENNTLRAGVDPVDQNTILGPNTKLVLDQLWVNYQYKTEFNPYHDHSGVYSFAIWMKIPYSWEEQKKLAQFSDVNDSQIRAGNFQFEYNDTIGGIKTYGYRLSPELEGIMLFFPARLRHCVYPFYEIDEPRISIAGNLSYLPALSN